MHESLKRLEEENAHLRLDKGKLEELEKENFNLRTEIQTIMEADKHTVSQLQKEVKMLGKKPVEDVLDSISIDKLEATDRLSFLMPISEEQSLWVQFKQEKHWLQCAKCGGRNHPRSKCVNQNLMKPFDPSSYPKVFLQRRSGLNKVGTVVPHSSTSMHETMNASCQLISGNVHSDDAHGHLHKKGRRVEAVKLEEDISRDWNLMLKENQNKKLNAKLKKCCQDNIGSSTHPGKSSNSNGGNINDAPAQINKDCNKTSLRKRIRFVYPSTSQERKKLLKKMSSFGKHRSMRKDGFKSLLSPKEGKKRFKQDFHWCVENMPTNPLSSLYF